MKHSASNENELVNSSIFTSTIVVGLDLSFSSLGIWIFLSRFYVGLFFKGPPKEGTRFLG